MGASRMRCSNQTVENGSTPNLQLPTPKCRRTGRCALGIGIWELTCCLIAALAATLVADAQRGTSTAIWFEGARLIVGDGSAPVENAAFLVEGDAFTWVGKQGQRQPPQGATRVDLSGKTVIPALIDGHNHIGLVNEKD